MASKNYKKPALLPSLSPFSPDSKRETFYQKGFSPNKTSSQMDSIDQDIEKSLHHKSVKNLRSGMTGMQLRSVSLATHADFKKRGINLNPPETPGTGVMTGTTRKEESMKKIALWERIAELKATFSRFYDISDIPIAPTKADIRRVISCLETLKDDDSGLADLMNIVVKVLKSSLYVNYKLIEPYEDKLVEECDEDLIALMHSCRKEGTPYHVLCMALVRELTSDSRANQKEQLHLMELNRLRHVIAENQNKLEELNADLKGRVEPNEHAKLVKELEVLTRRHQDTEAECQALKQAVNETTEENHTLRKQVEADTTEIDKSHALIHMLEKARDNVIKETEDSRKQIVLMKEKIKGFKDILDRIIIKLGNVKQQVLDLRHENEELIYQNEKLSLRAARGFDSLTPRADYRKFIEEKKLDMDIYDATGRRQLIPTIKIVEELVNRLQGVAEKNKGETTNRRKDKLAVPKPGQPTKTTPQVNTKRPSLLIQGPKQNKNAAESSSLSPNGQQKSFFQSPLGSGSPRARQSGTFNADNDSKMERSASKQFGEGEVEETGNRYESQVTENDDNISVNKSHTRNTLTNIAARLGTGSKKGDESEEPFGEETIKQANELINFVVDTKKAIDKFD